MDRHVYRRTRWFGLTKGSPSHALRRLQRLEDTSDIHAVDLLCSKNVSSSGAFGSVHGGNIEHRIVELVHKLYLTDRLSWHHAESEPEPEPESEPGSGAGLDLDLGNGSQNGLAEMTRTVMPS